MTDWAVSVINNYLTIYYAHNFSKKPVIVFKTGLTSLVISYNFMTSLQ